MSVLRGTYNDTISIVHSIGYITSWKNWWYYNLWKVWREKKECNIAEEDKPISALINESYTYYDSYDGSISMNTLKDIRDGNYVHPYINTRDARLKMGDCIRQAQRKRKVSEI